MKKIISVCLLLAVLMSSVVCVYAADSKVAFTSGSGFAVGDTVTVDLKKTAQNVMDAPDVTSDMYNAALEGNMDVMWRCSNGPDKTGKTVTWTDDDYNKEYVCRVGFYSDKACTQFIDYVDSQPFTVAAEDLTGKIPQITTAALPDAKVGASYYCKLTCTDADVKWNMFRSSLPDGLYITQHGEIEGTPTKAGVYYVVVEATPEAGEDYAAYAEFEFTVKSVDDPDYTIEIVEIPKKIVYTSGEKLDMTGLHVIIHGPDGDIVSKDGQNLTYSDRELVTLGEQKIALQYEDAFEIFIVTVVAASETDPSAPSSDSTDSTNDPTVDATAPVDTTDPNGKGNDNMVWIIVSAALGVLVIGLVTTIVILVKKKS